MFENMKVNQPMQIHSSISLYLSSSTEHNLRDAKPWETLAPPPMQAADE